MFSLDCHYVLTIFETFRFDTQLENFDNDDDVVVVDDDYSTGVITMWFSTRSNIPGSKRRKDLYSESDEQVKIPLHMTNVSASIP